MSRVDAVMKDTQFNAIVAWAIVAVLLLAGAASVSIGEPVWAVFVMGGVAIILLPAGIRRDLTVMPPWKVLVFAALPLTSQFFSSTGRAR